MEARGFRVLILVLWNFILSKFQKVSKLFKNACSISFNNKLQGDRDEIMIINYRKIEKSNIRNYFAFLPDPK